MARCSNPRFARGPVGSAGCATPDVDRCISRQRGRFQPPLMRKIEMIRKGGGRVQEIALTPLTREDLEQLIGDSLCCGPDRVASLAGLLHEKTAGNPFFAIQFLSSLAEEGLLNFEQREARWAWDLQR